MSPELGAIMTKRLALIAPVLGKPSETFIQRHLSLLHPGHTVAVAGRLDIKSNSQLKSIPYFLLEEYSPPLWKKGLHTLSIMSSPWMQAACDFLKQQHADVVLVEYLHVASTWFPVLRKTGLPVFAHAHGHDVSQLLKKPEWRAKYQVLQDAEGLITMSHFSAEALAAAGFRPSRIHVIPYGVDVPDEMPTHPAAEKTTVLAVGRMVQKKAPLAVLEAFEKASRRAPELILDYVGDGPLLGDAQRFAKARGLEGSVTFHGVQDSAFVLQKMRQADIFIQHSRVDPETGDEEGLPVAILEAMAAALPVVTTRHAGIPEAVLDGETGILSEENDVEMMADNLLTLGKDKNLRALMGAAAWRRAKEHFSWEVERRELAALMGLQDAVLSASNVD